MKNYTFKTTTNLDKKTVTFFFQILIFMEIFDRGMHRNQSIKMKIKNLLKRKGGLHGNKHKLFY